MKKVISNTLREITEKLLEFNSDLKKGNTSNIIHEINKTLLKREKEISESLDIVQSPIYGTNIQFIGLTSNFLFPSALYANDFRVQIVKDLKKFISNEFTIEELGLFLSKKIISTVGVKRGGFTKATLEALKFYFTNYSKVLDNEIGKYISILHSNRKNYPDLTESQLKNRFPFVQKYAITQLIPNEEFFSVPAILIENKNDNRIYEGIEGNLLGTLYTDKMQKDFQLLHISSKHVKIFRKNLIKKISFFENLDIYYQNGPQDSFRNKVNDIELLYCDLKEHTFRNTSIEYNIDFFQNKNLANSDYDLDSLIHIFNTRKIPENFEIHPELQKIYLYRNKIVTIFTTINYYIHIHDSNIPNLDRFRDLLDILLKNTFSNGFLIHYRTGILISTNVFREDFEKVKKQFQEFIWSLKMDCTIYENLNYVPFAFYRLPASKYYCNETKEWEFPIFEDKPVTEYFDHLALNYEQEMKRLEDASFKVRVDQTLERLTSEINQIKKHKQKKLLLEDKVN